MSLRRAGKKAVLLESGGAGSDAWSYVGIVDESVKVPLGEKGFVFMRNFLRKNHQKPSGRRDAPPFRGGFVGFISYDLGAKWQGINQNSKKDFSCPEAYFVCVREVIAFKNKKVKQSKSLSNPTGAARFSPAISKQEYFKKMHTIKDYLYAGETYQVNFSQRFESTLPPGASPFSLYQAVASINPSPFQFFLETDDFAVISNSPEKLFSLKREKSANFVIETKPIKGTVARGKNAGEDRKQVAALLNSKKDAAEIAMIIDLERNDMGKICEPKSVHVVSPRTIEKYSHVIHTVATIRGVLRPKLDWYDALRALFPGGSVTGCPKKRTMEIIDELEGQQRGVYCGSAGYIDLSGECNFNIMIRTLFVDKTGRQPNGILRSGGGIVVDSDPKKEYKETMDKAGAFIFRRR